MNISIRGKNDSGVVCNKILFIREFYHMASKKIIYKESEVLSDTELQGIEEEIVVQSFRRYFEHEIKPVFLYHQLLHAYVAGYTQGTEGIMAAKKKAKAVKKVTKKSK